MFRKYSRILGSIAEHSGREGPSDRISFGSDLARTGHYSGTPRFCRASPLAELPQRPSTRCGRGGCTRPAGLTGRPPHGLSTHPSTDKNAHQPSCRRRGDRSWLPDEVYSPGNNKLGGNYPKSISRRTPRYNINPLLSISYTITKAARQTWPAGRRQLARPAPYLDLVA